MPRFPCRLGGLKQPPPKGDKKRMPKWHRIKRIKKEEDDADETEEEILVGDGDDDDDENQDEVRDEDHGLPKQSSEPEDVGQADNWAML